MPFMKFYDLSVTKQKVNKFKKFKRVSDFQ